MMDADRALAPLNAESAAIDRLETYRTPQELAESLQAIGQAVERALRQLLRADTRAPDQLRLAALSSDDLPAEQLLSAVRKHELISIPLAGQIHELLNATSRAASGEVRAADADHARATVRNLRTEIEARVAERNAAETNAALPDAHARFAPPGARGTTSASAGGVAAYSAGSPAQSDAGMREAASNAIARGDIEDEPHPVKENRKALRGRAVLPLAMLAVVAIVIWGVMHFFMGGASDMDSGVAAFEQQRWGVAEKNFRSVVSAEPRNVTARLYLGRVLRVEGRAKEAGQVLNEARKIDPKDADVLRELGGVFMDLHQPQTAVTAYRQSQELDPSDANTWVGLVLALRAAGDPSAEQVMASAPAAAQAKLRTQH